MTDSFNTPAGPTPGLRLLTDASERLDDVAPSAAVVDDENATAGDAENTPAVDAEDNKTKKAPRVQLPVVQLPVATSWEFMTDFTGTDRSENVTFRIRVKDHRFAVIVPAKATKNKKRRAEIGFSRKPPFGEAPRFGAYVKDQLRGIVSKWKKLEQAREWLDKKKSAWRKKVTQNWKERCESARPTRTSTKRKLAMITMALKTTADSPMLHKAKGDNTVSIPCPFLDLGFRRTAVRLYPVSEIKKAGSRTRKAQMMMWLPAALIGKGDGRGKAVSCGTRFGVKKVWAMYVEEYLRYAISKWTSLKLARDWCNVFRFNFVKFLNSLFDERGYMRMPTARPWRLARSCVPICDKVDKYIDAGDFPPESKVHPGFGVYSVKKGKPVLSFSCQDKRIAILVDKRKVKLTKRQKYYQCIGGVEPDPKERRHWVWVPTSDALDCCVFPEGFFSNIAVPPLGKHELIVRVDASFDSFRPDHACLVV